MNIEKIRMKFWTDVYSNLSDPHEIRVKIADMALKDFDERFDIDEDFDVSIDNIIEVLKNQKRINEI